MKFCTLDMVQVHYCPQEALAITQSTTLSDDEQTIYIKKKWGENEGKDMPLLVVIFASQQLWFLKHTAQA